MTESRWMPVEAHAKPLVLNSRRGVPPRFDEAGRLVHWGHATVLRGFARASVYLGLLLGAAPGSANIPVVTNGRPCAVIVHNSDGGRVTALAVAELRDHIEAMTGARLAVVPAAGWRPSTGLTALVVGRGLALEPLGVVLDKLPKEGFRAVALPQHRAVLLAGRDSGNPLGTAAACNRDQEFGSLYAVYELLERWGVRWFFPGELGTVIPRTNHLAVAGFDVVQGPDFCMRNFWIGAATPLNWPAQPGWSAAQRTEFDAWSRALRLWALRNRAGNANDEYHTRHHAPDWWSLWGASHPEYLGLDHGVRGLSSRPERSKLCVSNPDLARALAERAKAAFRNDPSRASYSICEQDGSGGFCECAACRAWDAGAISAWSGTPSLSDRYARFWNAVASNVAAEFPDRFVGVYLYSRYADPPVAVPRLHPNIRPVAPLNYVVEMTRFRDVLEGWGRLTDTPIALYTTPLPGAYGMNLFGYPWLSLKAFGEGMRYFRARRVPGFRGPDFALGANGFAAAPMHYLVGRLAWRADTDPTAVLDDFCTRLFGPAAGAMRAYFMTLERWQSVRPEGLPPADAADAEEREEVYVGETRLQPANDLNHFLRFWSDERLEQLRNALQRAAGLAADATVAQRIARFGQVVEFTSLDVAATRACRQWSATGAAGDWTRFLHCATQRQELLRRLPPFAGVIDRDSLGKQALARGYEVVLDDPAIIFRSRFEDGTANPWRTRPAFDGVHAAPGATNGFALRGRSMGTEILIDRTVPLRGGGNYRLTLRWRASRGAGLRIRMNSDGTQVFNQMLMPDKPDPWTESALAVRLPAALDRVHLYLYLVADGKAAEPSQLVLDWIELRSTSE